MNSKCPIDAKNLSLAHSDRLDVMSCADCGGTWLPATSAGTLISRLAAATPQQQKFFDMVRLEGRSSKHACLECGTTMRTVAHRKVEIDVCQDCGGIWFDGGELQRFRQSPAFSKPAKVAGVVAGATALAAAGAVGAVGAAAATSAQAPAQASTLASLAGDVVVEGVLEVAGAILEGIFS